MSDAVSYRPSPIGENTGRTTHNSVVNAKAVIARAGQEIQSHFRSARMRPNETQDQRPRELEMTLAYSQSWA